MSNSTLNSPFQAPNAWIVDSGATTHITCFPEFLFNFKFLKNKFVLLPNGTRVQVVGTGSVRINSRIVLHNVLYIPSFHVNLISVPKITPNCKIGVLFEDTFVLFQDTQTHKTIGRGDLHLDLFLLYTKHTLTFAASRTLVNSHSSNCNDVVTGCNNVLSEQSLWHSRLGHVSDEILKLFANKNSLHLTSHSSKDCMVCPLSKFRRLSFISNNHYSESPFDLIHVDTWGPYQHATHDGKHYFLTIVDDSSRFTWLYLMKNKSEATQLIKNFFVFVKTNFDKPIKQLRSDNVKELKLDDFLSEQGTLH